MPWHRFCARVGRIEYGPVSAVAAERGPNAAGAGEWPWWTPCARAICKRDWGDSRICAQFSGNTVNNVSPDHRSTLPIVPGFVDGSLMQRLLKITIVESDPARAALIEESLLRVGQYELNIVDDMTRLNSAIKEINPDIVLIDLDNPSRDALEELTLATAPLERPVALFVDQGDANLTKLAIEAGVSAYVVDGLRADRLKPILDAAVTRFNMFRQMRTELAATKRALEERKVIDRAKGILMKAKGIDEEAAYALLRRAAMDQGRKVGDVAEALVSTAGLLS